MYAPGAAMCKHMVDVGLMIDVLRQQHCMGRLTYRLCTSIRQRISLSNLNSWRWRKSALESGLLESFSASLSVELSRDLLRV